MLGKCNVLGKFHARWTMREGSRRLLSATAVERVAVVSRVTVVPNARIAGVALTGLYGYKALAAMGKTLEHDGGNRILHKQEGGRAHKTDKQLFHTFSHVSMRRIVQRSSLSFRSLIVHL
jgi:hypothetical protein